MKEPAMDAPNATPRAADPLWTAEDVAAFLRVSLSMVYKLRRQGSLPAVRVGALCRFQPDTVRGFARSDGVAGDPGRR
jgi:excisionase family DNA binding protein